MLTVSLGILAATVAGLAARPARPPAVRTLGSVTPSLFAAVPVTPVRNARPTTSPNPTPPSVTPAPPDPTVMPDPVRVTISAIGVQAAVIPVGLVAGTDELAVPAWTGAGWYELGPSPGDPGSAVIVGHVDYGHHQGVFWRLADLVPGDTITVAYANQAITAWRIVGRQQFVKTALPAQLFSRQGGPSLTLITCGGPFDTATGHYDDNVVVVALLAR